MIKPSELIAQFETAYNQRFGYIWGTAGIKWTQERQDRITKAYTADPAKYKDYSNSVRYGAKWIDHTVADCSGLFAWAFKRLGGSIAHGSNSIWNQYTTSKGKITDRIILQPGTAVFLTNGSNRHHIGLWTGEKVIEARGAYYGVVNNRPLNQWDEWGLLKGVQYEEGESMETIRKGSRGPEVRTLQEKLRAAGCGITIDGIFGGETETALKAFQNMHGLAVDGICGPATWAALEKIDNASKDPTEDKTEKIRNCLDTIQAHVQIIRDLL